ncbi:hypothetical protein JCM16358_15600 [Halanaerocella petrolearia]
MEVELKHLALGIIIVLIVSLLVIGGIGYFIINNFVSKEKPREGIAVINVSGPIMAGNSGGFLGETQASSNQIMKYINQAKGDKKVKAILLRVNTPGGSSAASDAIYRELKKFKSDTKKPVVVSMGDIAASGGYYISAAADEIYANHNTITGSIGVIMKFTDLEELYNKIGIDYLTFKSGPHKDIGSSNRDMTKEEKKILQRLVNNAYQRFVEIVAEGRNINLDKVKDLADGRIYDGEQAKELDLVDKLGNFYDAVDETAKLAGIKETPNLIYYGRPSPIERLLGAVNRVTLANNLVRKKISSQTGILYQYFRGQKTGNLQLNY